MMGMPPSLWGLDVPGWRLVWRLSVHLAQPLSHQTLSQITKDHRLPSGDPSKAQLSGRGQLRHEKLVLASVVGCKGFGVTTTKSYRLPCLRYKITDVRLFKPGNVKGHEWTRRWTEGIADDISNWASVETRTVCVTEGYGSRPVKLRVRQFIPQEGDKLERTWMHQGNQRSVQIPPYAIVNLDEAKSIYTNFINDELKECCRRVVIGKDKLIGGTYGLALKVMMDVSTDQKERDLLSKAFRLWMAIRMTTKSTLIVGRERLGMKPDIMDETSPMRGQIPLPPVMGAQIELVLIHQLQTKWRREMLDQLQNMTQANNHSTWLTIYLVTFILLHNVSLLCQHDAAYAQKHGIRRPDGTKVGVYNSSLKTPDHPSD
ncbi:hypothetical protein TruAng_008675 [Truncatella angustata]|nr:hypothetical protein TruAng_008675 [Truncatella angustata]